ncbi:MAG TPA: adenylosuccinate synthetase, partial [Saprospiraceae bacterium]|nr:adenylosuccinate synthetase [Saprospiraceae bacterium]
IAVADQYKLDTGTSDEIPFDLTDDIRGVTLAKHAGWKRDLGSDTYEDLPAEVKKYLHYLEQKLGLPIAYISTGPGREQLIVRE